MRDGSDVWSRDNESNRKFFRTLKFPRLSYSRLQFSHCAPCFRLQTTEESTIRHVVSTPLIGTVFPSRRGLSFCSCATLERLSVEDNRKSVQLQDFQRYRVLLRPARPFDDSSKVRGEAGQDKCWKSPRFAVLMLTGREMNTVFVFIYLGANTVKTDRRPFLRVKRSNGRQSATFPTSTVDLLLAES